MGNEEARNGNRQGDELQPEEPLTNVFKPGIVYLIEAGIIRVAGFPHRAGAGLGDELQAKTF